MCRCAERRTVIASAVRGDARLADAAYEVGRTLAADLADVQASMSSLINDRIAAARRAMLKR